MYIGGVGTAGLHHLAWEVLDNAVDEAMNGFASNIVLTLHKDGSSLTVADDGRGIPVDRHAATKKSALEVIFTVLHAGGKFEEGNYKTAGGLHGVGASVITSYSIHYTKLYDAVVVPLDRAQEGQRPTREGGRHVRGATCARRRAIARL